MDQYQIEPIGRVDSAFSETDDDTGATLREHPATIVVCEPYVEGLTNFDDRIGTGEDARLDVIFLFDEVADEEIELASESGAGLTPAGIGGVFTRRTPKRPNRLGHTVVRVVERDGRRLHVRGLDALDGTPILDLKPHVNWDTHLDE